MVCLVIGHLIGYFPFWVFALLISGIGLAYSLWNIIKSIILSIEIQQSDRGEAKINGIINIAILGGILLGSYLGFTVFGARGEQGIYSIF